MPTALTNQYVVGIAAGVGFTLAVCSNGSVYAFGDNDFGELGTNTSASAFSTNPVRVAGISNVVWVSAPRVDDDVCFAGGSFCSNYVDSMGNQYGYEGGVHALAMTLDPVDGSGLMTNHYYGWGDDSFGEVGNDVNGGATNLVIQTSPAGPLQFCSRCQREVQLGTEGTFTAQCNGTLYLYFNTDDFGDYASGSYTASVVSLTNNVTVWATNSTGVAVGTVTVGNVYTFTASGQCVYDAELDRCDANGKDISTSNFVACATYMNVTNSICPTLQCFSLVGKIQ